ncbi:MAG: InlB B-repeat-containing protein [Clostridia bacterium]|nr:InlB B-repeat-containing protein [Clostridia bacterium]
MSKNKFFKKLLVAGLCALTATATIGTAVTAAGCKKDEPGSEQTHEYTVTFDLDGGKLNEQTTYSVKVKDGEKVIKPADPTRSGFTFGGWSYEGSEYNFDSAVTGDITLKAIWTANHEHTYSDKWSYDATHHWKEPTCGDTAEVKDKAAHDWKNGKCSVCEATQKIIQPTLTEDDDVPPVVDEDGNLVASYEIKADNFTVGKSAEDISSGIFTIGANTEIRTRGKSGVYENGVIVENVSYKQSIKLGGSSDKFSINAPAAGTLVLHIQDGSNKTDTQTVILTKPDGTTEDIIYPAKKDNCNIQKVTIKLEAEGIYSITRTAGTSDLFYASFVSKVKNTAIEKIDVASGGTVDYFVGQPYSNAGLSVNAIHEETGRISDIASGRIKIDYTAFDSTKAGTYPILVSYDKGGKTYETSYDVNVYSFESLTLGTDKIVKGANTSANNGTYVNHALRQFYFTGETFSQDGLSVILNGKNGENTKGFLLNEGVTVSTPDMSTVGKKTVSVSYTTNGQTKTAEFVIYVADKATALANATEITLNVNKNVADAEVGVESNGAYNFKTIQQSLDFLENCGIPAAAQKTINIAEGDYWEKLEIIVPNLTIVGAGADKTLIEYDSLYGLTDAGGFVHTTDSTATLNVREAAVNFTIKNITVSNYWNSVERFDAKLGAGYGEHRALAMLIQADKTTIDGCRILGYQDTIELFTGRQYIVNTYISGTTDFIFGTNNTTYFKGCTIHSISNGKTDGGYITAFKGCNKGDNDAITYGAIFDGCTFTADEDVLANKNTAIGRPWGKYAAVAVINSELGAHISTKAATGASKNERYVSMSGVKPTEATVQFVEYNNTGAGAISEAVAGMKMLTAAQAKNYTNLSVVFGMVNGKVNYSDVWTKYIDDSVEVTIHVGSETLTLKGYAGVALTYDELIALLTEEGYVLEDVSKEYKFFTDASGNTEYAFEELTSDGAEIYAIAVDKNFTVTESTKFLFNGTAGSYTETVNAGEVKYYGNLKIDGTNLTSGVACRPNGNWYYLNTGLEISAQLKAGSIVTIYVYKDSVGFDYAITTDQGTQNYTTVLATNETGNVTKDANGNYICKIVVPVDGTLTFITTTQTAATYIGYIDIEVPVTYDKNTSIDLLGYDGGQLQGSAGKWKGLEIDATAGKFNNRGTDIQVNAGVVIKFNVADGVVADDIKVVAYNGNDDTANWTIDVTDGIATLTLNTNTYIKAINIAYNA